MGKDAFFSGRSAISTSSPRHSDTVTALVVSMYVCFVVTMSSDLVLDRAEQTVWEVGFVLV